MITKPISFIIPCFNSEKTVGESIESIINLHLTKYEICLIDDCSTDNTRVILENYKKIYPAIIKVGNHRHNQGGAQTRNDCVSISKYPMIFCLDSDNILEKHSFRKFLSQLKDDVDAATFGEIDFFFSIGRMKYFYKSWIFSRDQMVLNDIKKSVIHPICDGNFLFSKTAFNSIGGYDKDSGALDAWFFGLKLLLSKRSIAIVRGTRYFHRTSFNSYWFRELNKTQSIFLKKIKTFNKIHHFLTEDEYANIMKSINPLVKLGTLKPEIFSIEKQSILYKVFLKLNNEKKS